MEVRTDSCRPGWHGAWRARVAGMRGGPSRAASPSAERRRGARAIHWGHPAWGHLIGGRGGCGPAGDCQPKAGLLPIFVPPALGHRRARLTVTASTHAGVVRVWALGCRKVCGCITATLAPSHLLLDQRTDRNHHHANQPTVERRERTLLPLPPPGSRDAQSSASTPRLAPQVCASPTHMCGRRDTAKAAHHSAPSWPCTYFNVGASARVLMACFSRRRHR